MERLIGRADEKEILTKALVSHEAELIAVYGRRRVGKTFLIRSVFEKQLLFELSGIHEAKLPEQLQNFSFALKNAMGSSADLAVPANWISAFHALQNFLEPSIKKRKGVIFFDEFPWIHSPKSNFLPAFEHFWNSWASQQSNLKVVICGSAASWMIQNIVKNKGGLHNRVSQRIRLMPFTLQETEAYLKSRSVRMERYQILQLYMAMGGIPQYLKGIMPGESAAQVIDRMCFETNGSLKDEFDNLYSSLFDNSAHHKSVIKALAGKSKGLTRNEIIAKCSLSSGGTATKLLDELKESGFIMIYFPFDKNVKEGIYKLCDEYSLFYLKFMGSRPSQGGAWLRLSEQASWKSWSGFAFETICHKHSAQIKEALKISAIHSEESIWRHVPGNRGSGVQIDLLFDRADQTINICEMKFSVSEFTITKGYADDLKQKLQIFKDETKTKKSLFLTMVTTFGVIKNTHYTGLVQNDIIMDALFEK